MPLLSVAKYLIQRSRIISTRQIHIYSPILNTRALSSSLNHHTSYTCNNSQLKNESSRDFELTLLKNQSHSQFQFQTLNSSRSLLWSANRESSNNTCKRNFSTSIKLRQKKDDNDKDKDKNKKSDSEKKQEELQKELLADWNCLSGFGKFFAVFLASSIAVLIVNISKQFRTGIQETQQSTVNLNEFSQLLSNDKASNLVYNSVTRTLYFKNESNYQNEKLANIDIVMIKTHIDKLYDSMGLAFANRQHITIEDYKTNIETFEKVSDFYEFLWTNFTFFIGVIGYFSVVTRIRNRRGGGNNFKVMFEQMKNDVQNQGKSQGKKGKGQNKKKGNDGGFFSAMQPASADIGTLIEPDDIDVGFADVAGCEEAKIEVIEIVDFLRNRAKYEKAGAEVPKGAIYHGPPGTGKTLLAKACAKEAGVNFIQCSGSDFIEMYVGLGSKRVRKLFEMARDNAPSILFIDEIDSVGGKRGAGGGGAGNSESNQTINSILAEMDGFNTSKVPVVIMGATNRLDSLDKALLRPGRFDRKIYVGAPDVEGRSKIFSIHLRKINTEDDKNELAQYLAVKTPGMAGAEIKNICNEAALHSVRNGDPKVTKENFEKATDRVIAGMEKQNNLLDPAVKKRIAIHESGHAVTSWFLEHCMPLVKVTITPRTEGTLGFALYQPDTNKVLQEKAYFLDQMVSTLAGRAAEDVFYGGVVSSGAHDDLKKVTSSAYQLIMRLGMGNNIRNINYHDSANEMQAHSVFPSQKTRELLDEEIQELVDEQYKRAIALVTEKKDLIEAMADKLMEKETILREDVIEILGERPFEDNMTFEAQTKHSKAKEFKLPPGLKHWEKSFRYKETGASSKKSPASINSEEKSTSFYDLPTGWEETFAAETGTYYLNSSEEWTSMRHPGKPMPDGWVQEIDDEGRISFIHEATKYKSWSLEDDDNLTKVMKKEIEEFEKRHEGKSKTEGEK